MLDIKNSKEVITKRSKKGSTYKTWVFECSECGRDIKAQQHSLKTHSGKCRRCSQLGKPYMFIFNELKNHRNRKVPFKLKYEELLDIIEHNNKCHYCETPLVYNKHSRYWGKNNTRAHQLDRKDNDKGYLVDNVVPCCWECNRLKSNRFTYEEFMKLSPTLKEIMKSRLNNI